MCADGENGGAGPAAGRADAREPAAAAVAGLSRRWLLAGGAAGLAAAGGGLAVGRSRPRQVALPPRAPGELIAARHAEHDLLAALAATASAQPQLAAELGQLRRDHVAHARALDQLLAGYRPPGPRSGNPVAVASSRAALAGLERRAAGDAAARALTLTGAPATLLASIAACEATHAELLA